MRIGIDIDGVLFPWSDVANETVMREFPCTADPGPHVTWDHLKGQIARHQWAWLWTPQGQRAVFRQTYRTYPGVVEAFHAILGSGHECHFVTHRDPALTAIETAEFLNLHFGRRRWAGLHVVKDTPKHSLMDWDVFVDDKPDTVRDMLIMTTAKVFAPVRPWNNELRECGPSRRFTWYTDPRQVAEWVISQ